MYNRTQLKEKITQDDEWIECHVRNCIHKVLRQRRNVKTMENFLCPVHNIYLSPTNFDYEDYMMNLLSKDSEDIQLLEKIFNKKIEDRLAKNNSKEAVTWNKFRYLEKSNLLEGYLDFLGVHNAENPNIYYWCYDIKFHKLYDSLLKASNTFGEKLTRGREPDILIETDEAIILLVCKTESGNSTTTSQTDMEKFYTEADNWFFTRVFNAGFYTIAIKGKKYELLRYWLLGLWVAKQKKKELYLFNLVLEEKERHIEHEFGKYLIPGNGTFKRTTWEKMYHFIKKSSSPNRNIALDYLENQTLGYTSSGRMKVGYRF